MTNKENIDNKKNLKKELEDIICNRIVELRKERNLTMEKLALQSGISKVGLSEIERSLKSPMILTIAQICAGLGITLDEFFNHEKFLDFYK